MWAVMINTMFNKEDRKEQQICKQYKITILWYKVFLMVFFHVIAVYGVYLCFTSTSWKTLLFAFVLSRIVLSAGSAGVHRLWSHRAYKAKLPLRIYLCIMAFAFGQDTIFNWARDHRVHHKHTDTDADPYNIKRGFFFAHMGWLLCKKHPAVHAAGKKLPIDDLLADPVIRFNRKYYYPMWLLFCIIVPTAIPVYFWDEKWLDAICVAAVLRYVIQLHSTFCANSVAHTFGYRPYNKNIEARESHFTDCVQPGEGSHNYHHAFPRDYQTKEFALSLNLSRFFIDLMAFIGQAYDLKMSSDKVTKARRLKTGDGCR